MKVLRRFPDRSFGGLLDERNGVEFFFRADRFRGPRLFVAENGDEHAIDLEVLDDGAGTALRRGIRYTMEDGEWMTGVEIRIAIENTRVVPFQPKHVALKLGLDFRVEHYPDWQTRFYPTFLRCERTHFTALCRRPDGATLAVGSPDPVACWHHDFRMDRWDDGNLWGAAVVEAVNLDLIHRTPLPDRHPAIHQLLPGESLTWKIRLIPVLPGEDVHQVLSETCEAPVVDLRTSSIEPGRSPVVRFAGKPSLEMVRHLTPTGELDFSNAIDSLCSGPLRGAGFHEFTGWTTTGKALQWSVHVVRPWAETLKAAALASLQYPQRASSHCESWYGFFSLYLAAKHGLLDPECVADSDRNFLEIFRRMFERHQPRVERWRVQNQSTTLSILVDRYEALGAIDALEEARGLADHLISNHQEPSGEYRGAGVHYTCVIYPAKSLLELAAHEAELGRTDPEWQAAAVRHLTSARKAIQDLAVRRDQIETEGVQHFEDGMISCAALQLGLLGLIEPNPSERAQLTAITLQMLSFHDCLAQTISPDARARGGTHRTWEAQFDIGLHPATISCPHGWSAWRAYATFYAYLLTGDPRWIRETMNALGGMSAFVDPMSGKLRWAFALSPFVDALQIDAPVEPTFCGEGILGGFHHPNTHGGSRFVIGEQYLDAVCDWFGGNSCDPDVHEVFKCIEEVFVTNAFVNLSDPSDPIALGCEAQSADNQVEVRAFTPLIRRLHIVAREPVTVQAWFESGRVLAELAVGSHWITAPGAPGGTEPWNSDALRELAGAISPESSL